MDAALVDILAEKGQEITGQYVLADLEALGKCTDDSVVMETLQKWAAGDDSLRKRMAGTIIAQAQRTVGSSTHAAIQKLKSKKPLESTDPATMAAAAKLGMPAKPTDERQAMQAEMDAHTHRMARVAQKAALHGASLGAKMAVEKMNAEKAAIRQAGGLAKFAEMFSGAFDPPVTPPKPVYTGPHALLLGNQDDDKKKKKCPTCGQPTPAGMAKLSPLAKGLGAEASVFGAALNPFDSIAARNKRVGAATRARHAPAMVKPPKCPTCGQAVPAMGKAADFIAGSNGVHDVRNHGLASRLDAHIARQKRSTSSSPGPAVQAEATPHPRLTPSPSAHGGHFDATKHPRASGGKFAAGGATTGGFLKSVGKFGAKGAVALAHHAPLALAAGVVANVGYQRFQEARKLKAAQDAARKKRAAKDGGWHNSPAEAIRAAMAKAAPDGMHARLAPDMTHAPAFHGGSETAGKTSRASNVQDTRDKRQAHATGYRGTMNPTPPIVRGATPAPGLTDDMETTTIHGSAQPVGGTKMGTGASLAGVQRSALVMAIGAMRRKATANPIAKMETSTVRPSNEPIPRQVRMTPSAAKANEMSKPPRFTRMPAQKSELIKNGERDGL